MKDIYVHILIKKYIFSFYVKTCCKNEHCTHTTTLSMYTRRAEENNSLISFFKALQSTMQPSPSRVPTIRCVEFRTVFDLAMKCLLHRNGTAAIIASGSYMFNLFTCGHILRGSPSISSVSRNVLQNHDRSHLLGSFSRPISPSGKFTFFQSALRLVELTWKRFSAIICIDASSAASSSCVDSAQQYAAHRVTVSVGIFIETHAAYRQTAASISQLLL